MAVGVVMSGDVFPQDGERTSGDAAIWVWGRGGRGEEKHCPFCDYVSFFITRKTHMRFDPGKHQC